MLFIDCECKINSIEISGASSTDKLGWGIGSKREVDIVLELSPHFNTRAWLSMDHQTMKAEQQGYNNNDKTYNDSPLLPLFLFTHPLFKAFHDLREKTSHYTYQCG
jgi:hypothetical protein